LECLIVSLSFNVVKSTFLMGTRSFSLLAKSKLKQHLLMNPRSAIEQRFTPIKTLSSIASIAA